MPTIADNSKSQLKEILRLNNKNLIANGYEKLTVSSSVIALTVPTNSNYALVVVESSITTPAIRYLELGDIIPPSGTDGIPRSNLDAFDIQGYQNLVNFRVIQVGAGTHTLQIQYYR